MSHFDSLAQRRLPSPDARILSWSGDHTLRLWDVAAGQTIGSAMTSSMIGRLATILAQAARSRVSLNGD